ncbi:MAG: pantoate--beta-alanine ligase [Acidiferrobacterales bacterium]|nr:pantoate--beta-alanine ligase [Acidiferrobacterales bacterium]
MVTAETIADLRVQLRAWRGAGDRIVFVPTMGNLHAGHLKLVQAAREHGQRIVVSIFVNPMQFDRADDFANYPRTRQDDLHKLEDASVDLVFLPTEAEIYPRPMEQMTFVEVPGLGSELEGAERPGHFRGVTTVVLRLFHLVEPDVAVFGKKDYQQLMIIRRMVDDLGMSVGIVGIETEREASDLALSSRNSYLTDAQHKQAAGLYATLVHCRDWIIDHPGEIETAEVEAVKSLELAGFRPDYISVRRQNDLKKPGVNDTELVILAAAWLGKARLIDNIELSLNPNS